MNDDLSLADMTAHEAALWRDMVEPPDDPLMPEPTPGSGPPGARFDDSERGEEEPDPRELVPTDADAAPRVLDLPLDTPKPPPELMLPDEPPEASEERTLEMPGEPGEAEMGPDGTVDSPPETAEPVLPVVDHTGDEFFPGEGPIETPPLPEDPELEMPQEPDQPSWNLNDWSIETTMDYSGGRRLHGRERVIDVNLSVPEGFEQELAKHIEPQMGLLREQVMGHASSIIEENAALGTLAGIPI